MVKKITKVFLFFLVIFVEVINCQIYRCPACSSEIKPSWEECPRCGEDLKNFDWGTLDEEKSKQKPQKVGIMNRTSLGINFPGMSFKYISKELIGAELRYQMSSIVQNIAARVYKYFSLSKNFTDYIYTGGEFDYIEFSTTDKVASGSGIGGALFVGYEKILFNHLGIGVDVSAVYISIEDKKYKQRDYGVDFVLNININYYF